MLSVTPAYQESAGPVESDPLDSEDSDDFQVCQI